MSRRTLSIALVGLLAASASPALAQGQPPDDPVATAAIATVATGSIGFDFRTVVRGRGTTARIGVTGAVELGEDQRGWMRADLSAANLPELELLVDGRFVYLRGGAYAEYLGDGEWIGVDLDSSDPAVEEIRPALSDTDDAALILYWLLGGTEPSRRLGAESLGGDPVDHYALPVDLDDARRAVPDELRPYLEDSIYELRTRGLEPEFETEVWIDEAGMVRSVSYSFLYRPAGVDEFRFEWDFRDFGEPVELQLPDPADVLLLGDSQLPLPVGEAASV